MKKIIFILCVFISSSVLATGIPGLTTFGTLTPGNQSLSLFDSSFTATQHYIDYGTSVSVVNLGADPTGVTDSTAAIQAAINQVSTGGDQLHSVFFPDGTYKFSSLTVPEGVELKGSGEWKVKLNGTGLSACIQFGNIGTYNYPQIIRELAIYCPNGTSAIDTGGVSGATINHVWFSGVTGVTIPGTADISIVDNVFDGTLNGVVFTSSTLANDIEISRNIFSGNSYAITIQNVRELRINGNEFRGAANHTIDILWTGTGSTIGTVIANNTFYTNPSLETISSINIKLAGTLSNLVVSGNTFDGCAGSSIYAASGTLTGILFNGNIWNHVGANAIYFAGVGTNLSAKNNIFQSAIYNAAFYYHNSGTAVFSENEIYSANTASNAGTSGGAVDVDSAALFVAKHNVISSSFPTYGFVIRSGVTLHAATDNVIESVGTGAYSISTVGIVPTQLTTPFQLAQPGGVPQAAAVYQGSGVPSNSYGSSGDYYLRTDTPSTSDQRIYINIAGTWTGVL